jgi:hypothetical protein
METFEKVFGNKVEEPKQFIAWYKFNVPYAVNKSQPFEIKIYRTADGNFLPTLSHYYNGYRSNQIGSYLTEEQALIAVRDYGIFSTHYKLSDESVKWEENKSF